MASNREVAETAAREIRERYGLSVIDANNKAAGELIVKAVVSEIATIITTALNTGERETVERCAVVAENDVWAPTDNGGMCLECREWVPARHSERWEHLESCSWASREFKKSPRIATAIRATVRDDEGEKP